MNIETNISKALGQNVKFREGDEGSYSSVMITSTVASEGVYIVIGYMKSVGIVLYAPCKLKILNGVIPIADLMKWERTISDYIYEDSSDLQSTIDCVNEVLLKSLKIYALYKEGIV